MSGRRRFRDVVAVRLGRSIAVDVAETPTRRRRRPPQLTLLLGFLGMTLVTTALLALPQAAANGRATAFHDALFTATSAVATSGLVVVDTGSHWSSFGHVAILIAMQAGGLGFMAATIILFQALGRQISRHHRQTLQEQLSLRFFGGISRTAKVFVAYTLFFELVGMGLLTWQFANSSGPGSSDPLFYGLFHSISAFTGSGFDLMGNFQSMASFVSQPLFLLTMMALIVPGDLGFLAVIDLARSARWPRMILWQWERARIGGGNRMARAVWRGGIAWDRLRRGFGLTVNRRPWPRHRDSPSGPDRPGQMRMETKLIYAVNLICWPAAALGFLLLEWGNPDSLGSLPVIDRITGSFFHAITSRNAGFSAVNFSQLGELTLIFMIPFMIIGAASASMGAGLKVNTVGVLFATAKSRLQGLRQTELFGRSIPADRVYVSVTLVAMFLVMEFLGLLVIHSAYQDPQLINSLFDSVSAVSDIGLSTGVPAQMSVPGKLFMCAAMFIARLGPLTVVLALLRPRSVDVGIRRPAESLRVG